MWRWIAPRRRSAAVRKGSWSSIAVQVDDFKADREDLEKAQGPGRALCLYLGPGTHH